MGKLNLLILLLVVMSHKSIHGELMIDDNASTHLGDGTYKAPRAAQNYLQEQQQQQQQDLKMGQNNLAQQAKQHSAMDLMNRDDDHSNIELDKLAAYRYEILPTTAQVVAMQNNLAGDQQNLARLFSKLSALNGAPFMGKRNFRDPTQDWEDKDYSFVAMPMTTRQQYNSQQQQRDGKWAAQMLRDMLLSRAKSLRFPSGSTNDQNTIYNLDQLSQTTAARSRPMESSISYGQQETDYKPNYREKRRRCKVDPNMGVKNPSFCDTDAYFGAADYSMRDVWDAAGKRR